MNKFFIIVLLLALPVIAKAQTNPSPAVRPAVSAPTPLPPGQVALNNYSNQIRALEIKQNANRDKLDKPVKKHGLETAAGIGNDSAGNRAYIAQREVVQAEAEDLRKQIAALKLKEYNLRELYKIPEPTKAKKKKP